MSIDPGGMPLLADRLELIRTISRNIAGTSETPDGRGAKTQETPALPDDPTVDGFVAKDDGSRLSTDSAGRDRATLLSSLMQALRPPIAGPGQHVRQVLNAALAQPLADLAQEDGTRTASDLLAPVRLASGSSDQIPYPVHYGAGDAFAMPADLDLSLTTHIVTDLSVPDVEGSWIADAEPSGVETPATALNAMADDKAMVEATRLPPASMADGVEMALHPSGYSASSALASRTFDAAIQAELILRALGELELGAVATGMAPMATERAGVLASFVLNAHFLPGWPPARPIESPEARALIGALAQDKNLSKSDIELLTYLANFGVSRGHLEKLLKTLKRAAQRPGLLRALACFLTNLSAALRALGTEVDAIITDLTLEEQLQARHASGNRRRIDLG
ncbi:MAG: hypothetical protein ACT6U0_11520 [Shinella sp.]|uniref:hypothetical protein n=1 Tax=Shinella sp. TaxID=1870904 RepID=UPI0040374AA5